MNRPYIKICGIQNPELASLTAFAGAHFIGIVFHPPSRRHVSIDCAKEISKAAYENGAKPIAVFVDQTAPQMDEICQKTHIHIVQLHGRIARYEHVVLSKTYQRIYVQSVLPNGIVENDDTNGLNFCDPKRDYLLFDNKQPGKGQIFNWNSFNYNTHFRIGLAGGLTSNNVDEAIKKFQPAIVDISSGVENSSGEKDITLIKNFISTIQKGVVS